MSYEQLQEKLSAGGFRTSKVVNVGVKLNRTVALHIDYNPFHRHTAEPKIKEICGDDFMIQWIGNGQHYFFITKRQPPLP